MSSAQANVQELAQLRDIHLPPPIGWWPLAPGWYALMLILMLSLFIGLFFLGRHVWYGRAKRRALRLLLDYQDKHQRDGNSQETCARVSELLKRVALVYFPREEVASLQGESWVAFLNRTAQGVDFTQVQTKLLELPYRPIAPHEDLNLFFSLASAWIKQRRKLCSN